MRLRSAPSTLTVRMPERIGPIEGNSIYRFAWQTTFRQPIAAALPTSARNFSGPRKKPSGDFAPSISLIVD